VQPHSKFAERLSRWSDGCQSGQCPSLSIVTPSFNQSGYLEETIRSVLEQQYPRLEYMVVDGASTDGSAEIIRRYANRLHWWVSEPDSGPEEAINKGFARTSGEIMGWVGSSDKYLPWAFAVAGSIFARFPEVEWLTTMYPVHWDESGHVSDCFAMPGYHRKGFFRGEYLNLGGRWHARGWIQAESTFWRRSLWNRTGGRIDPRVYASDFDLWARFYEHTPLWGVGVPLAGFRVHSGQLSLGTEEKYLRSSLEVLQRHGGRPRGRLDSFWRVRRTRNIPLRMRGCLARLGVLPMSPVVLFDESTSDWVKTQIPIVGPQVRISPETLGLGALHRAPTGEHSRNPEAIGKATGIPSSAQPTGGDGVRTKP